MKIYVAGRLGSAEEDVDKVLSTIQQALPGQEVTLRYDWRGQSVVKKPYLDHREANADSAEEMLDAAYHSDIFVLLVGPDIYMAMVEFGMALGGYEEFRAAQIFVVLPPGSRQSLAFCHPWVKVVSCIEEIPALLD